MCTKLSAGCWKQIWIQTNIQITRIFVSALVTITTRMPHLLMSKYTAVVQGFNIYTYSKWEGKLYKWRMQLVHVCAHAWDMRYTLRMRIFICISHHGQLPIVLWDGYNNLYKIDILKQFVPKNTMNFTIATDTWKTTQINWYVVRIVYCYFMNFISNNNN